MAPNQWINWTARVPCTTESICDNVWDGRLWDADGNPYEAPTGTYTWHVSFLYYKNPKPEGDTSSSPPEGYRVKKLSFQVEVS